MSDKFLSSKYAKQSHPMSINYSDFYYKTDGFGWRTNTVVLLVSLSILLSGLGVFLLLAIPVFILLRNSLIKNFYYKVITYLISRSNSRLGRFVSLLPRIEFRGKWFMAQIPERNNISSPSRLWKLFLRNGWEILLIQTSALIVSLRFYSWLNPNFDLSITFPFGLTIIDFVIVYLISSFISQSYFIIIWAMRDSDLKLINESLSSKGKARELVAVRNISQSYQSLFGAILGVPAIIWLLDFVETNEISLLGLGNELTTVLLILAIIALTGGGTLFTVVWLVNSSQYEDLVNRIRLWVVNSTIDKPELMKPMQTAVPTSQHQVVPSHTQPACNNCGRPNTSRYCTNCGFDNQPLYCMNCKTVLKLNQKFCVSCGAEVVT